MAVTRAAFLQQTHDDVANIMTSGSQMTAKIVSVDECSQNYDIGSPPGRAVQPQANDAAKTRYYEDDVNTAFRQNRQPFRQAFDAQPQGRGLAEPKDDMAVFRIHRKDSGLKKFSV